MEGRGPRAGQSEATRAALMGAARELFSERGYAGVGTEEILEDPSDTATAAAAVNVSGGAGDANA